MMEALFPPTILNKKNLERERRFISSCIDVVVTVFGLYGFDFTGFKRKGTIDHWLYCSLACGSSLKFAKYKFAAFYAHHKSTLSEPLDMPKSPVSFDRPSVLLGGRAYKWFMMMKNGKMSDYVMDSFLTTMLYAKKGMPRPNKTLLRKAERDTFLDLTQPVKALPEVSLFEWGGNTENLPKRLNTILSKDNVISEIKRTIHELFVDEIFTINERIEPFFPSTSANYINSRNDGGVVGVLMNRPDLMKGLTSDEECIQIMSVDRGKEKWNVFDDKKLRHKFFELYKRMCVASKEEAPIAVPLALPEALKIRVISKGPALHYTILKPLQKKLWSVLRKNPVFSLIGEPVTSEYIQERMGSYLKSNEKFLSVDYSNATNEMYSWVSDECVNALCDELMIEGDERVAFFNAMTRHEIVLEKKLPDGSKKVILGPTLQTRGQLMGSVVSFPILCIANAAICRWAKEISDGRIYTLKDCPLAINGDDAILRINDLGRVAWGRIGTFCGLSPSVGKVYFSNRFLNINSTTYNFHPYKKGDSNAVGWEGYIQFVKPSERNPSGKVNRIRSFELVQYVNLGLLNGMKRSGGDYTIEDGITSLSVGTRCTNLINDCPSFMRSVVMRSFIHRHVLNKYFIPWFIPERFGGLGLPIVDVQPYDRELRLARKIYEHPKVFHFPSKPVNTPWSIWKYATNRFPDSKFTLDYTQYVKCLHVFGKPSYYGFDECVDGSSNVNNLMVDLDRLRGLACVELLFRAKSLSELYVKDEITDGSNYLRAVSRVWKRALLDQNIKMPEPFNPRNYPADQKVTDIPILFRNNVLVNY